MKLVSGIGSAPPPPWAFAVPVKRHIVNNVGAKAFNMFLLPCARAQQRSIASLNEITATEPNTAPPRPSILAAVKKYTIPALRYLSWAIASFCLVWLSSAANSAPQIGASAPELVVTELDGQIFDLAKLKGKVVLVNYWATWCAPCKKDMPKLDAFYRRHHGQNLEVIGISVDRANDLPKVRKIRASLAYPVAALKDVTVDGFGEPEGVPITWIIDSEGKVHDRMIDVRDELLNTLVVPLLSP